jgi:hypothetical protein
LVGYSVAGRRRRGARWLPVALVSVLVVGLAVVTAVVLSGSKTSNSPVPATAARAQRASTVTKGSKWLDGSGTRLLTAVNADLGKVSAAEHAGSYAAARAAGERLAADATAALRGPMPPVDAKVYRSALKDLKAAGSYEAGGNFRKAARLLAAGRVGIMKVTAAADLPVREKTPAVAEPNGD